VYLAYLAGVGCWFPARARPSSAVLEISFISLFLRDNFTANAVSPPAEVALATISPMLAKQNGHIASPLNRVAKRDRFAASTWMTGWLGPFLHQATKGDPEAFWAEIR
jgi:hypothetical protein